MQNKLNQNTLLLSQRIQTGFQPQDAELLKIVSSSSLLHSTLMTLDRTKARKRVILRCLYFSIFMQSIFSMICLLILLIMLGSEHTYTFQSATSTLIRYTILFFTLYGSFKLIKAICTDFKIIATVQYIDEFDIPTPQAKALQQIEHARQHNYQCSEKDDVFLKIKFKQERKKIRKIGLILSVISASLLAYSLMLPPQQVYRISSFLPFLCMLGIGLFLSPRMHPNELRFLYASSSIPFKYYPKVLKVCLILSAFLCVMMLLWKDGVLGF